MKTVVVSFLDYVLPRFCVSCRCLLNPAEKIVCGNCYVSIKHADANLIEAEFNRKFAKDEIISDFTSLYIFEKDKELQDIIHALKYNKRFLIGYYLGDLMGRFLESKIKEWNIDYIIPVPLHKLKRLERGYNQSYFIAKGLSRRLKVPVKVKLLKRIRYTESQTMLTKKEREDNMRDAFKVLTAKQVKNKNILLLDDVITTGATITECGRQLLKYGAEKIFAVSAGLAE